MGEGSDKGYRVIRSKRRTLAIELRPDGSILVRAPYAVSRAEILLFLKQNEGWIRKKKAELLKRREEAEAAPRFTEAELNELKKQARDKIPERVRFYAEKAGVTYGKITVRAQKTRWGSCSAKGDLSFNCLLMCAPEEALDSVIVHELCHRKEMNHSAAFYREVYRVFPAYDGGHGWLKKNGRALLLRLPE